MNGDVKEIPVCVSTLQDGKYNKPAYFPGTGSFGLRNLLDEPYYFEGENEIILNYLFWPTQEMRINSAFQEAASNKPELCLVNEAIEKIRIKIDEQKETIDKHTKNLINAREADTSLAKSIELLASIEYKAIQVSITHDFSIFFTVDLAESKKIYFEHFLERTANDPDIVYLVYKGEECIANGYGSIDIISKRLLTSIQ